MVAYSFQKQFVTDIQSGFKRQTIRAHRRRHARPGEPIQLYSGMRTRHCTKIIDDPVCVGVDDVIVDLSMLADVHETLITAEEAAMLASLCRLIINGDEYGASMRERFARQDGFSNRLWTPTLTPVAAWTAMVMFWARNYGLARFEGVAIRWEPRS